MLMNSVFVVGTLMLNLVAAGATDGLDLSRRADAGSQRAARELAITDSFAPPPRRKAVRRRGPRPAPAAAPKDAVEEEEEEAAAPPRRPVAPTPRRRPVVEEDEESASGDEDEEEEDAPRVKRKRKRVAEEEEDEEEEDDDTPMASMPSVVPRLFSAEVGIAFIGRNFSYNTPMQKESTFPRLGATVGVETYPLLRTSRGWVKRFGVGLSVDTEFGAAALKQPNGSSVSFPVTQRRWVGDLRYAILAGEHVVILPAVGLASGVFDLKTTGAGIAPSACNTSMTMPCLADVNTTSLSAAAHIRVALTEEVALSVGGGYIMGLSVGKAVGQIGSERTAKLAGYYFEIGGNMMLKDWLAFRAAIPFTHYGYAFSGGTATYSKASETYYGLTISALVFTH